VSEAVRALTLLASLVVAQALHAAEPGRVPRPAIKAGDGASCVADKEFMKKNHMDLLKHQRDGTMHMGLRTQRFSLKGCVNCHAGKATGSVIAAPDDFCRGCHVYSGVTLDCFECHSGKAVAATRPTAGAATGGKP
jgi:hypothetical protein